MQFHNYFILSSFSFCVAEMPTLIETVNRREELSIEPEKKCGNENEDIELSKATESVCEHKEGMKEHEKTMK